MFGLGEEGVVRLVGEATALGVDLGEGSVGVGGG